MTIEVIGPDQSKFQFPDGTPEETISGAMAKHYGAPAAAPAAPTYDRNAPQLANQSSKSAFRGIPFLGSGVEKASAAISAAAQPLTGVGDDSSSIADRYVKNLEQEEAAKLDYEKENPIASALGGMVGGTLALGGIGGASATAAKVLGMTGKLVPAATRAATSGAVIGAGDAALRGEDPIASANVGALTGAGGVMIGKGAGKVWDAARGLFREAPAAVPTRTMPVNGVDVPVRESVITRNPAASEREQGFIHGAGGEPAQLEARAHAEATDAAMGRAHGDLEAALEPTGTRPTSPMAAGEAIGSEVAGIEAQRAAAEATRLQAIAGEGQAIRADLNTSPTPGVLADTPRTAGERISEGLIRARDRVATARDRAYDVLRGTEGEFNPAAFQRISNSIRTRLNAGSDPVRIDAKTPYASNALDDIEANVGQLRFENRAEAPMQRGPDGRPEPHPITAESIDAARKRLISMQRAARSAARASGDDTDVRAVRRVVDAFDDHVARVARTPGGFSGDGEEFLRRHTQARGLHSALKRTFGPENPKDDVGKAIEKIVGRRDVTPAEIEAIVPMLFGNAAEAGGALQTRVARRVTDLFGADSQEVAVLKQGLISHITDVPAGTSPLTEAQAAERIHKFFSGTKGVGLAQTLFSPSERARMLGHANRLRQARDPAPEGFVEKTIAKWSGREGGIRASPKTIVDDLMGSTGQKGTAPALVEHLRDHLSPETYNQLKVATWKRITEGAEGTIPWKDQKVGQRIMNFLNGDGKGMADALFSPAELKAMREIADAHIKMLPIEGTTNPSKSGHVIERAMKGMANNLLPFLGFHAGGLPGAAAAFGAKSAATKITNSRSAKAARELFYGEQPKRVASQLPQRFGAIGGALAANQSR